MSMNNIEKLYRQASMTERERLLRELERIEHYRLLRCITWDDEQRALQIKRRLADLAFGERP